MPDTVNAAKNPDLASYARSVETEFKTFRVAGLGKLPMVQVDALPTDNSINFVLASGTTRGTVPVYFDGASWFFLDDAAAS